jgi:NAD(P)-dependent dehydrogenase (short-subunit alcohol dehydrogenase family)
MNGRVAVVTGAAQGNGRAIAERLAAEGATVVCGDRNEDVLRQTVREIGEAGGGQAHAVRCDVTVEDDVEALLATAEELGGPHAVVAQAGTTFGAPVVDTTVEEWDRVMAVDVRGTFLTVRAALPRMRALGGGSIVTMSGTYALWAEPGTGAHCAAKGAILAFTRAVAVEHGHENIRCNAILPGYVATPMVERHFATDPDGELQRQVERWHGLNRIARPDEVAALALFLCSDESSFCSGQPFTIDGAMTSGINVREAAIERTAR